MLQSDYFKESQYEIPPYRTFGGSNPSPPLSTITHLPPISDNLNVNVIPWGDVLLAISDMSGEVVVDRKTLASKGQWKWKDNLSSLFAMITTAHPSKLPGSSETVSYHAKVFGNLPYVESKHLYRFHTTKDDNLSERELIVDIPVDRLSYVHSFAHTNNYIGFVEFPLLWDVPTIIRSFTILPAMKWTPERNTKIYIIDKAGKKVVREATVPAFFAYHHVNAFESNGSLVMDICAYDNADHLETFRLSTLRNNTYNIPASKLVRYSVPLAGDGEVKVDLLAPISIDLAVVNPFYMGKEYRYVYGIQAKVSPGDWWNTIVKVDVTTGKVWEWFQEHHYPSEPAFVPAPGGVTEDEGTLLVLVMGGDIDKSYLLVMDAASFTVIATVDCPLVIPFTSHGFFEPHVESVARHYVQQHADKVLQKE